MNSAPVLSPIATQSIIEGQTLTFSALATDNDLPIQTLTYSVDPGAPAGATINPANGLFTWTPTEAQGPSTNALTIRVTDNGTPSLFATQVVSILVLETNSPPAIGLIDIQNADEGALFTLAVAPQPMP